MTKDISNMLDKDDWLLNVTLKDGTEFHRMNITSNPFGDHERVVSFWVGNVIRVYPMSQIAFVELVPWDA